MKRGAAQDLPGYETSDASARPILLSGAVLLGGLAVCFAAAAWLEMGHQRVAAPEMSFHHGVEDDSTITRDWRAQDELVRQHLTEYGWVDRNAGWVRIPLERAMDLAVKNHEVVEPKSP